MDDLTTYDALLEKIVEKLETIVALLQGEE